MMNNQTYKMILVLVVIGILSASLLAYTAQYTYPLIEKNRQIELENAILRVLPEAETYQPVSENKQIYTGLNADGDKVSYAFVGGGAGYQGNIRLMIGISKDWQTLEGVTVLEDIETPGLGAKINSRDFLRQFRNLKVTPEIEYVLNKPPQAPNEIQAITGATISSRAVVNILNQKIDRVKKQMDTLKTEDNE